MQTSSGNSEFYDRAQRRIGLLTLALGLPASAVAVVAWSPEAGAGMAVGAVLAWLNYRWLEGGANAITRAAVQAGQAAAASAEAPAARVSPLVYLGFFGRYILIGVILYVIVIFLAVPILSVLVGLLALGAAALAEGLYEVFSGTE